MAALRRWAVGILSALARHAPESSREWAVAMLRELDSIEGDWAAFWWAFGSIVAICRHAGREWGRNLARKLTNQEERTMDNFGKKTGWLFAGMGAALVAGIAAALAFHLAMYFYPPLRPSGPPWLPWLVLISIPQVFFIVKFWRKRRPVALGILFMALAMSSHFAMYAIRHWNR